ncbi:MAG: alcohol dehydrogenase catalytic domain-containing protein [Conexivisphaerales archaeon]
MNLPDKMKAAVLYAPLDVRVEDVPIPELGPNDVIIRVDTIGICPSDVKNYIRTDKKVWFPYGKGGYGLSGHEFSGMVTAVGSKVSNVAEGDLVVPEIMYPCGRCKFCRRGLTNLCSNKEHLNHGYAEYARVDAKYLFHVPDSVTPKQAAFTEPLAVVLHTNDVIKPRPADTVLIVGSGPMGLLHLMVSKLSGARVIVSEINEERLKVAKELGADVTVNPAKDDMVSEIKRITEYGADAVIVTIGNRAAIESGISAAGPASTIAIFASAYPDISISINPNIIHWNEFKITGSYEHMPYDMIRALELMANKKIDPMKIVTGKFTLDSIKEALDYVKDNKGLKAQVSP